MSVTTTGDLRQFFLSTRNTSSMKTELNTLVQELTTGQASDLTAHLGANQSQVAGIDRQLQMLERFAQSNIETGQMLSTMQSALSNIDQYRASASDTLLTITGSSSASQISGAGASALAGFEATVQSLNMRYGDRSLFGGNVVDRNPLAPSLEIIDSLKVAVSGLTEATDISVAVDAWFETTGGGFETDGYQGDALSFTQRPVDKGLSVDIPVRADDSPLRDTLKAFALGALAGDADLAVTSQTRQSLMRKSAEDLLSVASPLSETQGRIGQIEGQIEEASTRIVSQETSLGIARNNLVLADPFETATRLEAVQSQLETHYTLTARLSRLSLTEYLR